MTEESRTYFISYFYSKPDGEGGAGSASVRVTPSIATFSDVIGVQNGLAKDLGEGTSVIIMNWKEIEQALA